MSIEADVRDRILAVSSVTAITSNVYVGYVLDPSFPFVRLQRNGAGSPTNFMQGSENALENVVLEVDCYAADYYVAADLATKVRRAITGEFAAFKGLGLEVPVYLYDDQARAHRFNFEISTWFYS